MKNKGFTLIELLVVIFIIAVLTGLAMTNFLGARQRARDARRKQEVQQLKQALRLYYNDFTKYPADSGGGPMYNIIKGCQADGTAACPCNSTIDFASGSNCDVWYMKKFPSEFLTRYTYWQFRNGDDFLLKSSLENSSDPEAVISKARCPGENPGKVCGNGDYCVCAD